MWVARQTMGTERVKLPWINSGLPFSSKSIKRSSPTSVMLGSHEVLSSRVHSWDSMARLLEKGNRQLIIIPPVRRHKMRKRSDRVIMRKYKQMNDLRLIEILETS